MLKPSTEDKHMLRAEAPCIGNLREAKTSALNVETPLGFASKMSIGIVNLIQNMVVETFPQ
jgi:hypothetical protein